MRATYNRGAR